MNRRSFFTGLATLAVWPMAIRPRMRRDVRVVEPHEWTPPTFKAWPGWEEGTIMHSTAGGQWEWRGSNWIALRSWSET